MDKYTIGIICFLIITVVLIISDSIKKIIKNKRDYELKLANIANDTKRLELYINFDFDKIDDRISKYIEDFGTKYRLEHFEFMQPDEIYLTEDMMNDMIKYITKSIIQRITPAILMLLQLSYNINNEEELAVFLYERVKIYVFNYSLQVNGTVDD